MYRKDRRDRLKFDHDQPANEEIDPIAILDRQLLISDRDRDLASHADPGLFEFVDEARFIGTLQQSRTDSRMDLHRGADDCMPDILLGHLRVLRVSIASFARYP